MEGPSNLRMLPDRFDDYPQMCAACIAISPKIGISLETLLRQIIQIQTCTRQRYGSTDGKLREIKKLKTNACDCKSRQRNIETGFHFRLGARPSPMLICDFINHVRGQGFRVDPVCADLREQGC